MRRASVLVVLGLVVQAVTPIRGHAQSSAEVFQSNCARCHGETGRAAAPIARTLKVPPLVHDARLAQLTPQEIANLVKGDPKHRSVVRLRSVDLEAAAVFVKELAGRDDD